MATVESIVDDLRAEFDVTQAKALAVLNDRLQDLVTRSTALRAVKSLGTTVAAQTSYALDATIVKVLKVWIVNGTETATYEGTSTLEDFVDLTADDVQTDGRWYTVEPDSDSSMLTENLRLYPAPSTAGRTITGLVALRPAAVTYATATALPIPTDVHDSLYQGARAKLFEQESRQDEAAVPRAEYEQGIKDLLGGVQKRGKGSQGTRMRIRGYDLRY
jgi:hypothetical protein